MKTKQRKGKVEADALALARAFAEKYRAASERDIGEVYAGIWDIYDSTVQLYGEILPRIAAMENPTDEDLQVELIDLYFEMKHIKDHARDAIRGLRRISKSFGSELPPG